MIPDKSVNLIVIDPPYNIGIKGASWDKYSKEEYLKFMSGVFTECHRVLKDNGSFYWFHNDMQQIAQLMTWLDENSSFVFNSFVTWDKGDWRALSWKNPSDESNLRSWFNTCEYLFYYSKPEEIDDIKQYLISEKKKSGLTLLEINQLFGIQISDGIAKRYFGNSQWELPTREKYEIMQTTGYWKKPYDELKSAFDNARAVHHVDPNHNNVWRYKTENSGKYHACQKPLTVIERIIKSSSNESDIVLDCFMGSGTTAVAATRLSRKFIGFERESEYVQIANQRLEAIIDSQADRKLTE
ncbi:DNA-methyltransferase [Peribacillus huizhouensis]|uniref:Methyltransferase n=1 Tax=Peribacillus huizhouensis TaxID=1501239 RepID=A0ABR6CRI7_9BACI|nr:site-specific DNA-methyltransferase (adenine-specific) [Peribacillus huizhouensis]